MFGRRRFKCSPSLPSAPESFQVHPKASSAPTRAQNEECLSKDGQTIHGLEVEPLKVLSSAAFSVHETAVVTYK